MRLFISYAHVDRFQVTQIVDILRTSGHDPWFDHRLLPGQDWKATLLNAIRQCDAFVYVMTPESLASEWCQWEFAKAVELGKPVIPIRLQKNITPPEALSRFQWADFSSGPTPNAVAELMGGLFHAAIVPAHEVPPAPENPSGTPAQAAPTVNAAPVVEAEPFDVSAAIKRFGEARNAEDWETAAECLRQIRESGQAPRYFRLAKFEKEVKALLEEREFQSNAARHYAEIKAVAAFEDPAEVWGFLQQFWETYPDYDPDGLAAQFRPGPRYAPEVQQLLDLIDDPATTPPQRLEIGDRLAELGDPRPGVGLRDDGLPDIDWVEIPGGVFQYGGDPEARNSADAQEISLPTFYVARYPVTWIQFQAFVEAPDGMRDARWWQGLAQTDNKVHNARWAIANRPRENVTWYQAVAFCRWLSAKLGVEIMLPTEQQWEKAARGTDGRIFPWGNDYISGYANIRETHKDYRVGEWYLEQTTAVGLYPQGASPYGLLDVCGNVWEWCSTEFNEGNINISKITNSNRCVLRGGAFYDLGYGSRAAFRFRGSPQYWYYNYGFRCVRS